MGSVWLADHLSLQSQVAVKFMAPAMAEDEVSVRRFRQEAKAAAEIRSPNVVQVFDYGKTDDDQLYIVMEMLEGYSLTKWVKTKGAFSVSMLASVVVQSCKALAKAHERGIFHRDIKPANVFLIDSGGDVFVKLLDFGVAKFSGEEAINMTAAGNMVGTPAFMSPEQLFHGREVDHRGDLWSLAVVAYYALIGKRPFEGKTLGELCVSIKAGKFTLPGAMRNDLSPDIDAWFARAFHGDLEARFQSAKDMAVEMERACGMSTQMTSTPSGIATMQTFPGTSVSSHTNVPRPKEPKRWPLAVAAVAVVATGVGVAALLVSGMDKTGEASSPAAGPAATETVAAAPGDSDETLVQPTATTEQNTPPPAASAIEADGSEPESPPSTAKPQPAVPAPPVMPKAAPPTKKPPSLKGEDDRSKRAAEQLGI
jgi:serine/threonine protein kinase